MAEYNPALPPFLARKRERGTASGSPSLVFVVNAMAAPAGRCQSAHRKSGAVIRRSYRMPGGVITPFPVAYFLHTPAPDQLQHSKVLVASGAIARMAFAILSHLLRPEDRASMTSALEESRPRWGLLLFRRYHRFFERLRQAEFHHRLGRNLDGLAGLRIATHASLAICLHRLAQPGNHKLPAALRFLRGQRDEFYENRGRQSSLGSPPFRPNARRSEILSSLVLLFLSLLDCKNCHIEIVVLPPLYVTHGWLSRQLQSGASTPWQGDFSSAFVAGP